MKVVIYTRVSTDDQNCQRQINDLQAFAAQAGYDVIATFTETASGMKNDRQERAKVMKLVQARKIDAVLVTEMTRWGRSTTDVLKSLEEFKARNVSLIAQTGMQFDLATPQGKMFATILASINEFERDMIAERTKSGLKTAVAKGIKLGRPTGCRTVSKHEKAVSELLDLNFSYAEIASKLKIGKDTVMKISKARRAEALAV